MKAILDPLYGEIQLDDETWAVSKAPEVQRLREVRMCNINSLSLTGAGGAHRFEHSIGTAYLAQRNSEVASSRINATSARHLRLAALLHDVGSAGFGHSVEYIIAEHGFAHDDLLAFSSDELSGLGYEYKIARFEPVFFGLGRRLPELIDHRDLEEIARLVRGEGYLGRLISGSIDLDNIDNVYRLAYHMGLWRGSDAPVLLAEALTTHGNELLIEDERIDLIDDWRSVRAKLYTWLLLDQDEFAAKAMLEKALRLASAQSPSSFRWRDVDYDLMIKLRETTPDAARIVTRLMTGELFGTLAILETTDGATAAPTWEQRMEIERRLTNVSRRSKSSWGDRARFALHFIQDKNKTDRTIMAQTTSGRTAQYGSSVDRTLVGIFLENLSASSDSQEISAMKRSGLDEEIARQLSMEMGVSFRPVTAPNMRPAERLDFIVD